MKLKNAFVSFVGALGLLAVALMGTAQAHCITWDPVFWTCIQTKPDTNPPTGWQDCVNPGNPSAGYIQLFRSVNYGDFCVESNSFSSSAGSMGVPVFSNVDWQVKSVKSRRLNNFSVRAWLYPNNNYGGTAWVIPNGDTPNVAVAGASFQLWHL